jgi:hypothetical protein
MKSKLLLATLIVGTIVECVMARGFGGGLSRGGHSRGYWAYALSGANDDAADTVYDLPYFSVSPPTLENSSGTGFGNPTGISSAQAVNQEMNVAPPQADPNARLESFASEASRLGIRTGGFTPGEFGPMRIGGRLPTDMGMYQGGTMARAGNSAADLRVQGNKVRENFKSYDTFGQNWYRDHPAAWPAGIRLDVWNSPTWADINRWFGNNWDAFPYDYGTDLAYENNIVYLNGRPYGAADKYFQRASELARIGEQAQSSAGTAANWLPLGVFEAIPPQKPSSNMLMQLAVNKEGIIRGNYYDPVDRHLRSIEGSIDKNIGRSVWVVTDRKDIKFDTSLYNLTRHELAVLVHVGSDKNERWVLVRLQRPTTAAASR